jgi:hypothetical protein
LGPFPRRNPLLGLDGINGKADLGCP